MSGNLQIFYNTVLEACNRKNPPCLYSMDYNTVSPINGFTRRMGGIFASDPWYGTSKGTPLQYFDCSGLMSYALWKAGYTERNVGFTTFSEYEVLKNMRWSITPYTKGMPLRKGDILWYNTYDPVTKESRGHTECVFDEVTRQTMGATGRGTPWGNAPVYSAEEQVKIHPQNTDSIYNWQYLARDTHGMAELKCISEDRYLTDEEMLNNAYVIASKLVSLGYSMPVTCAILGNMARESTMSPVLTERGGGGGYGLVQWTPKSDLTNVVSKYNLGDYTKYDVQCTVFDYECGVLAPNTQWYDNEHRYLTNVPFMSFAQYKTLSDAHYSIADLTSAFMVYYERPAWNPESYRLDIRVHYAELFYSKFKDGIFNGIGAWDFGFDASEVRKRIVLMDKVRKRRKLTDL